jgi:hypothetical protein
VILAILATVIAGAQCVVACAQPAGPPPCHHAPQKAAKACDSSSVFGERQSITVIEAPFAGPVARNPHVEPPDQPGNSIAAALDLRLRPPGDNSLLILRI